LRLRQNQLVVVASRAPRERPTTRGAQRRDRNRAAAWIGPTSPPSILNAASVIHHAASDARLENDFIDADKWIE
jgi:hypothetical protein